MVFEAKTTEFSGPMEKLLALIEDRRVEISRINLAEVTSDFIAYVEQLGEQVSPTILSDFVVIASRLLVLKSKILLPNLELTGEEEADIMDLEQRLRIYREFSAKGGSTAGGKSAAQYIAELWDRNTPLCARPLLRSLGDGPRAGSGGTPFFYPSSQVTALAMVEMLQRLLQIMGGLVLESATVRTTMVSLQDKILELTGRLQQNSSMTFSGRMNKKGKEEVIVLFLAVLHMLANRLASVEQGDMFGEITVQAVSQDENGML